jgi:uncharacterized protein (TIGR02001 family)
MIKSRLFAASALLAVAGAAHAEFTVTPAITNDYDFRGLTQTDEDFAFQLDARYAAENGFYVGAWGSNVKYFDVLGDKLDTDVEVDLYAGFAGGDAEESFGYDVGAIVYAYPGSDDAKEVVELYAGISKGWFSSKLWFSPDNYDDTSFYLEGNGTFPLPQDFAIVAHVGYSFGDYWKPGEYMDYSIGVTKNVGNFAVSVKWVDTDIDGANTDRVVAMISTTLPWASK